MNTRQTGVTIIEILTALVVLAVVAAVALQLWQSRDLRNRRLDAVQALEAVLQAQNKYFGAHARFADADELGLLRQSNRGLYEIDLQRAADELGYMVRARLIPAVDQALDLRCVELRLDHLGRRSAFDEAGLDTSADCWRAD